MSVFQPSQWTRQPHGVVSLDLNHPLLKRLAQGVVAGPVRNATTSFQYSTRTSTSSLEVFGNGEKLAGSTGYIAAPTTVTGSAWTYIVYGVLSNTSASALMTTAASPGSNTRDRSLFINSSGQIAAYLFDGAEKTVSSGAALTVGVPFMAAAVANGSSLVAWSNRTRASVAASNFGATYTGQLVIGYGGGGATAGGSATLTANATIAYALKLSRAIGDGEWLDLVENPWQIFQEQSATPIFFDLGGGTQTLTPSLYTNDQVFYSPTVTPGAVTLQPGLYTNDQTFYEPTVTQGSGVQTITPDLFTNTQSFYSPTIIQASPQTIEPELFINNNQFFQPTVIGGEVVVVIADVGAEDERRKKRQKKRDEEFASLKEEKDKLRQEIERVIDPVVEQNQPVVVSATKREVRVLSVSGKQAAIAVPESFNAGDVAREIAGIFEQSRIQATVVQRAAQAQRALAQAQEEFRRKMKRRRDDELLLLMD